MTSKEPSASSSVQIDAAPATVYALITDLQAMTEIVKALWDALAARDWEATKPLLTDDAIYLDVPVGPQGAARGPEDIIKRQQLVRRVPVPDHIYLYAARLVRKSRPVDVSRT